MGGNGCPQISEKINNRKSTMISTGFNTFKNKFSRCISCVTHHGMEILKRIFDMFTVKAKFELRSQCREKDYEEQFCSLVH